MKLKTYEINAFVKAPDPSARIILIYGPDQGLVKEHAQTIGQTVVQDLNDPFNAVTLSSDQATDDPARLLDEASAMSMMGGNRLIRVTDAKDGLTVYLKDYLANPSPDNLIVLEAGELSPRSSLRKLCETSPHAVAIPCYVESAKDLSSFIRETLHVENLTASRDAINWLAIHLAGDRLRARSETEKLITYMQGSSQEITLQDAIDCCGEGGDLSLDDLIYSLAGNNPDKTVTVYDRLLEQGIPVITILRSAQNHFRRLHLAKARSTQGEAIDAIMRTLSPPIFFKYNDTFKGQVNRWSESALETALNRLAEVEAQSKMTGTPIESLCGQTLLSLSLR